MELNTLRPVSALLRDSSYLHRMAALRLSFRPNNLRTTLKAYPVQRNMLIVDLILGIGSKPLLFIYLVGIIKVEQRQEDIAMTSLSNCFAKSAPNVLGQGSSLAGKIGRDRRNTTGATAIAPPGWGWP